MDHPFFSIVIPTYNQSGFLKKTLLSLKKQTFKNFETIIVDNYSTDKTYEVIKNSGLNCHYYKIRNYGIIAKSRNFGLSKSKGKWIAFLDSDDYWAFEKLSVVKDIIKKIDPDVICNNEWVKKNFKIDKINSYGPYKKNFYEHLLKFGNCLSTSATLVKKKFISQYNLKFDEDRKYIACEDYDFFLNIAKLKGFFFFVKKPLGVYLIHSKSSSFDKKKLNQSKKNVLIKHIFNNQYFTDKNEKKRIFVETRLINRMLITLSGIFKTNKFKINKALKLSYFHSNPFLYFNVIYFVLKKKFSEFLIFFYYHKIINKKIDI